MSKRLTGLNPLAYIGVDPLTPPQMYIADRPPTINDARNFNLGDLWVDKDGQNMYVLVSLSQGYATWITSSGATTFEADIGSATDVGGIIGLFGDGTTITTEATGVNEITFSLTQGLDGQLLIGADGASAQWASITSGDNSVLITPGINTLDLTVDPTVVIGNGTDGQLLIGGGSAPQWASLTSDGSIIITPGVNTLEISAPNATGLTTIHGNSGTATQVAGAVTISGNGTTFTTSGSGSTLTVGLVNGSNGQLLIGGGSSPAWANLTSMGGTVTITNGANSINLEASGGGSSGASTFITDSGNALENLGDITIAGGNNISTSGAGQTVTIDVSGTTNHCLQVGNSSGSLTSLAAATNGQIPIGRTGLDPILSTITAGSGISIINASGSITISAAGGGSSNMIVTPFTSDGTWTKNVATKYVEVYGWGGGGGGGSGGNGSAIGIGGTGGGSTSMFHIYGPAAFFGATENVVVGVGGSGGAPVNTADTVGNPGQAGTPSSFGNVFVPEIAVVGVGTYNSSAGLGGSVNVNANVTGVGYPGVFEMGSGNIFSTTRGSPASSRTNRVAFGGGGGRTSFQGGSNGNNIGGVDPTDPNTPGSNTGFLYTFMLPTAGGGGSPWNNSGSFNNPGGNGGNVISFDTTTVVASGGLGGQNAGSPDGANGTSVINTDGSFLLDCSGFVFGGTGGGGGKGKFGSSTPGNGGDGGFPGGGGGGGGGSNSLSPSGAGGSGADGFVLVIEWT